MKICENEPWLMLPKQISLCHPFHNIFFRSILTGQNPNPHIWLTNYTLTADSASWNMDHKSITLMKCYNTPVDVMIHLLENLGTVIFSGEADCITINYEAKVYISFKIIVMFPLSKNECNLTCQAFHSTVCELCIAEW